MSKNPEDYSDRPYEIGRGKPPRAYRFQKGQSGNPKGRPKKDWSKDNRSMNELLSEIANELVKVTINNIERWVPKRVAISMKLMNDMLTEPATQRLKAYQALYAMGAFDQSVERSAPSYEARQKFLARLAEEADDDEESERRYPRRN